VASKRRLRQKACVGKIQYATFDEAMVVCIRVRRQLQENVHPYRCPFGQHFHTGHQPYRVKQAIAIRRGF
jgi:hypothetical protein